MLRLVKALRFLAAKLALFSLGLYSLNMQPPPPPHKHKGGVLVVCGALGQYADNMPENPQPKDLNPIWDPFRKGDSIRLHCAQPQSGSVSTDYVETAWLHGCL